MKNIIVPIDFSTESINGLKLAVLFTKKQQSNIQMINVLHKNYDNDKQSFEADFKAAQDGFEKIVEAYKSLLANKSELTYEIRKGRVYQEIVNKANQIPDSIIASSTHGASGFQEFFIGSNTFRIISATERPVITLRKDCCPDDISKIVLPIDLSNGSRQKVPFTTDFAKLFGAEIHVVGIHSSRSKQEVKKIRSYIAQVAGYIEGKVHCENNEVFGDNVPDMLLNYANTIKADLISITTEQPSGISLILGNTAHQILNKAEIPVLCLTPKHITKSGSFASMGG